MRVAMVAETFEPAVNGVSTSVRRVADELAARAHDVVVLAPGGSDFTPRGGHRVPVVQVPSVELPGYPGLSVARPGVDTMRLLRDCQPDVVHLASPAVLGGSAIRTAARLNISAVAVFQTDLSAFARRYHLAAAPPLLWSWLRQIHARAALTLVPSTATAYLLRRHGIERLAIWPRGVAVHGTGAAELIDGSPHAGRVTGSSAEQFAAAVTQLLSVPDSLRRRAARGRAEGYPWPATIERFLVLYRELGSGQFDLERNEHQLPLPAESGWALG